MTGSTVNQVDGFRKRSRAHVFVVPRGVTDAAAELIDGVAGKVEVSTPSEIAELL